MSLGFIVAPPLTGFYLKYRELAFGVQEVLMGILDRVYLLGLVRILNYSYLS